MSKGKKKDETSEGHSVLSKAAPIIVITWVLSLVTTLAVVCLAPNVLPFIIGTHNIARAHVRDYNFG